MWTYSFRIQKGCLVNDQRLNLVRDVRVISLHRNYNLDHSKFNRSNWYDISSKNLALRGGGTMELSSFFPFHFKLILFTIIFLNFHNGSLWEKMDVSYLYFLKYLMKLLIWRLHEFLLHLQILMPANGKHFYEW